MARFITQPGANVGLLRVGIADGGEIVLADFSSGEYVTDNEEYATVLRSVPGVVESDAPVTGPAELVDVRNPHAEVIVPGAPRAGIGVAKPLPAVVGDRTDGGEAAGQVVFGQKGNGASAAPLVADVEDPAAETAGSDPADAGEAKGRTRSRASH